MESLSLAMAGLFLAVGFSQAAVAAGEIGLRVAIISDLNGSYGTVGTSRHVDAAIDRLIDLEPDLVLCTGDMIAGQKHAPRLDRQRLEAMWRAFHEQVTDPLARAGIPFAPAPGNHDASEEEAFNLERKVFEEQWVGRAPAVRFIDRDHYPFRYAFSMGDALFLALDATRVRSLPPAQLTWLQKLLNEPGDHFESRVVFGHLPNWPVAVGREKEYLGDHEFEAVLRKGSASLYLSGHHHAFYPGVHGGVLYISQAALGSGPRRLIGQSDPSPRAITLLTFGADGSLEVEAFAGSDFSTPIVWHTLPSSIRHEDFELIRRDLATGSKPGPGSP